MGGNKQDFTPKLSKVKKKELCILLKCLWLKCRLIFFWRREEFDFDFKPPEVSICVSQLWDMKMKYRTEDLNQKKILEQDDNISGR